LITHNVFFQKKDSVSVNSTRTMYLYKHCLIDITISFHFEDEKFIKMDTTSYTFYNFDKQTYIEFKSLTTNIEVIKEGKIDEKGAFSSLARFDPLSDVPDSAFVIVDTVVNGINVQKVKFASDPNEDSVNLKYAEMIKFWVNPKLKNFPLQLSHSLSKKRGNTFVYQREMPFSTGDAYTIMTFDYQPKKLPDSLISIFKTLIDK
jgi:hypothetical protein